MTATLERPPAGKRREKPLPSPPVAKPARQRRRTQLGVRAVSARVVAMSVAILGLFMLGFAGYLALLAPVQQTHMQTNLYKTFAGELALATAPVSGAIPVGAPVAVLEIPQLDLVQVVVEGTRSSELTAGPGHRRDSVLPGQEGVSIILGRSALFGAPFGRIGELEDGDTIVVTTGQARSTFEVTGLRDSTDVVPPPTDALGKLVLSTAAPPLAPTHSLILTADLTSSVQPGAPLLSALEPDERALAGATGAALPLMLWIQALLLVVIGASWSFVRWQRWPTYLVVTPILLAILWNVYENAAQLLPNTM